MKSFDFLRDPIEGLWGALRPELQRRFIAPLIFGAAVLAGVAVLTAIDAHALRSALSMQTQAEVRLGQLDREMETLKISRESLQVSQRRIRRLQDVRASGFYKADRIARLGNALEPSSWITSISTQTFSTSIKGESDGLSALSGFVAKVVQDPGTLRLSAVRFSSDSQVPGRLSFELQMEAPANVDNR